MELAPRVHASYVEAVLACKIGMGMNVHVEVQFVYAVTILYPFIRLCLCACVSMCLCMCLHAFYSACRARGSCFRLVRSRTPCR